MIKTIVGEISLLVNETHRVVVSVRHYYVSDPGLIPGRVQMLGSVSVNNSLTTPRCKIGTNPMLGE